MYRESLVEIVNRANATEFIKAREEGFKRQIRLDLQNPFDYHTQICYPLALKETP